MKRVMIVIAVVVVSQYLASEAAAESAVAERGMVATVVPEPTRSSIAPPIWRDPAVPDDTTPHPGYKPPTSAEERVRAVCRGGRAAR